MKIIAILESSIDAGGAFNQGLNAILQMKRICDGKFDFSVLSTKKENIALLNKLAINCAYAKITLVDKAIARSSEWLWCKWLHAKLKIITPFEKKLIQNGCDLVYFLTQSPTSSLLRQTNFITTVFDLCHRDMPEFPEVRSFGKFKTLENHFINNLPPAILIITESEKLSESLSLRYGVDPKRCLAMPMDKSPFIDNSEFVDVNAVMLKHNLQPGYFFYPAQFWAHKNHIRILEALKQLKSEGFMFRVVFVGGDKGNRRYVENFIFQHRLEKQVRILGFVPAEDIQGLYEGCSAVIMPTYFGPTNLPPIEAWFSKRPLIYSAELNEQAGDAAIYVDPDNASDLASAMKACEEEGLRSLIVGNGIKRLNYFSRLRQSAEVELTNHLLRFKARRDCWRGS